LFGLVVSAEEKVLKLRHLVVVVGVLVVPDDAGPLEDLGDVLQRGSADRLGDDLVPGPHDLERRQRGIIKVAFTRTIKR
jgi:hypothetical protein